MENLPPASCLVVFIYFALRVSAETPLGRACPLVLLGTLSSKSTGAGIARSEAGSGFADHLSSQSLHRSRRYGMHSRAKSSVLFLTSSGGIEPSCISIIR